MAEWNYCFIFHVPSILLGVIELIFQGACADLRSVTMDGSSGLLISLKCLVLSDFKLCASVVGVWVLPCCNVHAGDWWWEEPLLCVCCHVTSLCESVCLHCPLALPLGCGCVMFCFAPIHYILCMLCPCVLWVTDNFFCFVIFILLLIAVFSVSCSDVTLALWNVKI